jgi:hypothetical protein
MSKDKIAPAFIAAKKQFGPVLKNKSNPGFKGAKYANLEACLDAVDVACLTNGIALYQETFEDATGITVETVFLHESGQELRCGKLHIPASKQDPQGYGSAMTYARRYSLLAACGIASEDDDGNAASQQSGRTQQKSQMPKMPELSTGQPKVSQEAEDTALGIIEAYKLDDTDSVIRLWYKSDISQDVKSQVWGLLKSTQGLREFITKNKGK